MKHKRNTNLDDLIENGDKVFTSACIVLACFLGGSIILLIAALIAQF